MQMRQVAAGTAMVLVLTATAACGSSSSSSAAPKTGGPAASSTSTAKTTSSDPSSHHPVGKAGPFKGLDFCKVLTDDSLTAIGLQPSQGHPAGNLVPDADPECEWAASGTKLELQATADFAVDLESGETKITILGYPGIADSQVGNSCETTMQVGKDELEVTVENDSGNDNPALVDKACDVAKGFTTQVLSKAGK